MTIQTRTITASNHPGLRVVLTVSPLEVDNETFVWLQLEEPLGRESAIALAEHLRRIADQLSA